MLAEEEFAQKRRDEYEEQMRVLLSRTMSDNGGLLTKGYSDVEMDKKSVDFFKDLLVLQSKYIDVIRENWGFERDDDTATFGEDFTKRWPHFVKITWLKMTMEIKLSACMRTRMENTDLFLTNGLQ